MIILILSYLSKADGIISDFKSGIYVDFIKLICRHNLSLYLIWSFCIKAVDKNTSSALIFLGCLRWSFLGILFEIQRPFMISASLERFTCGALIFLSKLIYIFAKS
jgi:hypothetical protein